ncbi:hypothetical protein CRG98_011110 [Punica granatum]|uniref:Uncharacterized protein n=1 Tax=Punica granatum TaxID=22663 RepID=A0A2I0KJ20_PUNGR|nr:hypothetical protein CRG98_011110 [Punica granatum]
MEKVTLHNPRADFKLEKEATIDPIRIKELLANSSRERLRRSSWTRMVQGSSRPLLMRSSRELPWLKWAMPRRKEEMSVREKLVCTGGFRRLLQVGTRVLSDQGTPKHGYVWLVASNDLSSPKMESESREGPLGSDGMTRLSHGSREAPRNRENSLEDQFCALLVCEAGSFKWQNGPWKWTGESGNMGGGPEARKSVLLGLDDQNEVDCLCRLFVFLYAILLALACIVLWAEQLTRRPEPEIENQRRPGNLRSKFSQYFPSVLIRLETTAISVCRKQAPKSLPRACVFDLADPAINSNSR